MTPEERRERDARHAASPVAGDCWSERLTPVLVVLDVNEDVVTIADKKVPFEDGETWDLDNVTELSKHDLQHRLSYQHIPGYWASVGRKPMQWAVDEYRARAKAADFVESVE